jgi:hypothetical protein
MHHARSYETLMRKSWQMRMSSFKKGETHSASTRSATKGFWGAALQLHQAIIGASVGCGGLGISPRTALNLGLKVDIDALPQPVIANLRQGRVNLDDPATTVTLLKLNAVVGLKGFFQGDNLNSIGITCAACHSTVDNSLTFGVGLC